MDCAKIPNRADKKQKNDLCPVRGGCYRLEKGNTICDLVDKNYKLEFNLPNKVHDSFCAGGKRSFGGAGEKTRFFVFTGA